MDTAFFPYGNKTKEFLIKRSLYLCKILFDMKVDKIIFACNTLSVVALPFIKEVYNNVEGIFDLFNPYFKKKYFIIGSNTLISNIDENMKKSSAQKLINAIEYNKNVLEELEELYKNIPINTEYLLLGCTHFIWIKDLFYKYKIVSQDDEYKKRQSI